MRRIRLALPFMPFSGDLAVPFLARRLSGRQIWHGLNDLFLKELLSMAARRHGIFLHVFR